MAKHGQLEVFRGALRCLHRIPRLFKTVASVTASVNEMVCGAQCRYRFVSSITCLVCSE